MAWSLLAIPGAGTIATIAGWATKVVNNFRYLKGIDGVVTTQSGLIIDNTLGSEYVKLPLLSTTEAATVLDAEGKIAHDEATHRIKVHDGTAVRSLVSTVDVDDVPVNAATTDPISSNWAYDFQQALTTAGDFPYATAAGVWDRRAIGTANQVLRVNTGATAPEWGTASTFTLVRKTADETVNNSDVLQNDNELLLPVLANEVWAGTIFIKQNSSTVADIKFALIVPAGATMIFGSPETPEYQTNANPVPRLGRAAEWLDTLEFIVANAATAGNIQLQWAQATAEATNTIVRANSYILAHKLA